MATVTNLIFITHIEDRDNADSLNEIVTFRGDIGLVSCDDARWYGGDRSLGVNISIGACAGLDVSKLAAGIRQVAWRHPESVQLFICDDKWAAEDKDFMFIEIDWRNYTRRRLDDR